MSMVYRGRCACGAIRYMAHDCPEMIEEIARYVRQMKKKGYTIEHVATDVANADGFGEHLPTCRYHKTEKQQSGVLVAD